MGRYLVDLHSASSVEELWAVLLSRIIESGVLAEGDEQQLAEWFVGTALALQVEDTPSGRREIVLADESGRPERPLGPGGTTRTGMERPIWPPLRRWAAAHLVAHDPSRWRVLLEAAAAMSSRDAAALCAGVMDAAAHIPLGERSDAVMAGLSSGSGIVRVAALPAFAALEGTDVALRRAGADPSTKVRAWARRASPVEHTEDTPGPVHAERPTTAKAGQDSLF
ncbi:MAG: hypothetical protein ACRD12_20330 [Acidimicrobiales bacterium]